MPLETTDMMDGEYETEEGMAPVAEVASVDDNEVSMAFAQKSLANAIKARKEAALAEDEEAYRQAQEKVKMWTEHLNDFAKKDEEDEDEEDEEQKPSLLRQAGNLFNNLK